MGKCLWWHWWKNYSMFNLGAIVNWNFNLPIRHINYPRGGSTNVQQLIQVVLANGAHFIFYFFFEEGTQKQKQHMTFQTK